VKRARASEQTVAAITVAYLEQLGADVYQEVQVSGGVADIVARVGFELWIVEVKTSMSLALVAQAMERRRLAHRVFVAAPTTKTLRDILPILDEVGLGMFEVTPGWDAGSMSLAPRVVQRLWSRRWNTHPVALARELKPEHKTHAKAGAVGGGGRWTPFRGTCEELARVVAAEPGIALKAAITKTKHHYRSERSAISSLAHWCQRGRVAGVKLARSNGTHGTLVLFPVEVAR
jgi:hypothetical protein